MGDQSTIALLRGINSSLEQILALQRSASTNKGKQEKEAKTTATLSKSGISGIKNVLEENDVKASKTALDVNTLSSLSMLPKSINDIANIKSSKLKNFKTVVSTITDVLESFNSVDVKLSKNLDAIKSLSDGLKTLDDINLLKLSIKLNLALKTGFTNNLQKFFTETSKALQTSIKKQDIKNAAAMAELLNELTTPVKRIAVLTPVIPLFVLGSAMMYPGIKILVSSLNSLNKIKDPKAAAEVLKELNSFTKQLVLVVGSTIALGIAINKIGAKSILAGLGYTLLILAGTSGIAIASGFLASKIKNSKESMNNILKFSTGMTGITLAIIGLSILASKSEEDIKKGLPIVSKIFVGLTGLGLAAGLIAGRMKAGVRGMNSVAKFLAVAALTTAGVILFAKFVDASNDEMTKGLLLFGGVLVGLTAVTMLAAGAGLLVKTSLPLAKQILKVAALGLALTAGTILIGTIMQQGWEDIIYGIGAVSAVIMAYGISILGPALLLGAVYKAGKPLVLDFLKIPAFALAITAGTMLIGAVISEDLKKGLTNSYIFLGTSGVASLIIAYSLVIRSAAEIAKDMNTIGTAAMYDVMKLIGFGLLITAGTVIVGRMMKDHYVETGIAFIGLTAILAEAVTIARLSTQNKEVLRKGSIDYKNVMLLMGSSIAVLGSLAGVGVLVKQLGDGNYWKGFSYVSSIFALMTAIVAEAYILSKTANTRVKTAQNGAKSLLIYLGVIGASEVVLGGILALAKNINKEDAGKIAVVYSLMTANILGAAALAQYAKKLEKPIKQGAISLLAAEGIILGSEIILGGILLLSDKLQEVGVANVGITFAAMTGVVLSAAGLAYVASKVPKQTILQGAATIALMELLIIGSAISLGSIILVTSKVKELGEGDLATGFKQAGASLLAITGLLTAFTGLSAAASFALPFVAPGILAIGLINVFALGTSLLMNTLITITEKTKSFGDNPQGEIKKIEKTIWALGDVVGVAVLGIPTWVLGSVAFATMLPMIASMTITGLAIVGVRAAMNKVGINDPEELGVFVDKFTNVFKYDNFKLDLSAGQIVKLKLQYASMSSVFDSLHGVAKAISLLTQSIGGMEDDGRIVPIIGRTSDGKPIYGKPINLGQAANSIVDAITTFSTLMNSGILKISSTSKSDIEQSMKVLSMILDPVSKFAEALTGLESGGEGKLRSIKFDEKGNRINTPFVNVADVAKSIASTISIFVETLFGAESSSKWMENMTKGYEVIMSKNGKKVLGEKKSNAEVAMGVLSLILEPVSNFVETLTTFEAGDNDTLIVPVYDKDGNIKDKRHIHVITIAKVIAGAVATFTQELFGAEQAESWMSIITNGAQYVTKKKGESEYLESPVQKAMGSLGAILAPVSSFASMLTLFGSSADSNKLITYDKDGKPHEIDVLHVAKSIGSAVSEFLKLFVSTISENADQLLLVKDHTEVVSQILNSFGTGIQNLNDIKSDSLTKSGEAFNNILSILITNGTDANVQSIKSLGEAFGYIYTPLTSIISSLTTLSANNVPKVLGEFNKVFKEFVTTINNSSIKLDADDINLGEYIKKLFSVSLTDEDLKGFENVKIKYNEYKKFVEDISQVKITSTTSASLMADAEFLVSLFKSVSTLFDTELDVSKVSSIDSFLDEYNNLIVKLSTISTIKEVSINNFISISGKIKTFVNSFIEIVKNSESAKIELLDLVGEKIISFMTSIESTFGKDSSTYSSNISGFSKSFDSLIKVLTTSDVNNIDKTSKSLSDIKTSYSEFVTTLSDLDKLALASHPNVTSYDNALDMLFTNISNMTDTKKLGKLNSLDVHLKTTTTSLGKLDNAFLKTNDKRIEEIKKLTKELENLSNQFKSSQEGISMITDLIKAANSSDKDKVIEILKSASGTSSSNNSSESVKETSQPAQEGKGGILGNIGRRGLTKEEVQNAIETAVSKIFDGAQIYIPNISVSTTDPDQTIINGNLRLDVNSDVYEYSE